jgi:hypothetical protein
MKLIFIVGLLFSIFLICGCIQGNVQQQQTTTIMTTPTPKPSLPPPPSSSGTFLPTTRMTTPHAFTTQKTTTQTPVTKPIISLKVTGSSVQEIHPCKWSVTGELSNQGNGALENIQLVLIMTPEKSGYSTVTNNLRFGYLDAGSTLPFSLTATVQCEGSYSAIVRYSGEDVQGKFYSGSYNV